MMEQIIQALRQQNVINENQNEINKNQNEWNQLTSKQLEWISDIVQQMGDEIMRLRLLLEEKNGIKN